MYKWIKNFLENDRIASILSNLVIKEIVLQANETVYSIIEDESIDISGEKTID